MSFVRNVPSLPCRAWIWWAGCCFFGLSTLPGSLCLKLLQAQTPTAPSRVHEEAGIPRLFDEFPRSLSSEERARVAEGLTQALEIALNHENDSTCPLEITRATVRSVEISRETEETPLHVVQVSFGLANNTGRRIAGVNCGLYRAGSVKEVPLRLFRSIQPYGSRQFSIPSSISPQHVRYLPVILKERPGTLTLKIDGVAFEDGTGWGDAPELATAPLGASQPDTSQMPRRIRVGRNLQEAHLLRRVPPTYPPSAKQSRIEGVVALEVTIDRNGGVAEIQVTSGHPQLVDAALQAVRQWKYDPTLLNDNPVEVVSSVEVHFRLTSER